MPTASSLSLRGRALRYLAAREHSRLELERKLRPHAQGQPLGELLDDLVRRDLLSDTRRVESLLHRRADRLGAVRLRQELGEKGIDRQEIDAALEGLKSTEPSRARQVLKKKFGALAGEASERARQTRFLLSRGFATDTVRKALTAIDDDCDPDS